MAGVAIVPAGPLVRVVMTMRLQRSDGSRTLVMLVLTIAGHFRASVLVPVVLCVMVGIVSCH